MPSQFDEHLHPRDKDGQFIKRLGQVRLPNGRSAIVVDAEPSAAGTIQVKDNKSGAVKTVKANTVEAIGDHGGPSAPPAAPAAVDWSKPNVDITPADQEALHKYGWDQHSYAAINAGLRTDGRISPGNQPLVDKMTSLIDRAELPADTTLHRHTYVEPGSGVNLLDELRQARDSGGTWTDKGFMSTSLSREHADDMDAGTPDEALKMEIHAPKGSKALVWGDSIKNMPGAYDQQEVTLQRGSQFKVDKISKDRDGTTRVRLSLVGAEPHQAENHRALRRSVDIQHSTDTLPHQWDSYEHSILDALHKSGISPDDAAGLKIKVNRHPPNGRTGGYDRSTDTVHIHPDSVRDNYSILHELGHRDSTRRGLDHSAYDTPDRVKAEENHADRFAAEHGADMSAEAAKAHEAAHVTGTTGADALSAPAPAAAAVEPAETNIGAGEIPAEPGYVYHATNEDSLYGIAESGEMTPQAPDYGTEQEEWPDGSTADRSYFSERPATAEIFSPQDGKPVMLRMRRTAEHRNESTGDVYKEGSTPASDLEYRGADNAWHPVTDLATPSPADHTAAEPDRASDWGREADDPREYAGVHQPNIDGPSLDDLTGPGADGERIGPDNLYNELHYHNHGTPGDESDKAYKESIKAIRTAKGRPDAMVTIYRAAPPGVDKINHGDWITLSPTYAEIHARQGENEADDWPVHSTRVPARDVRWDGNDLNEFGYAGASTPVEHSGQIRNGAYVNKPGVQASARPEGAETIDSAGGGGARMVAAFDTTALVAAGTCSGPGPCDVHPLGHGKNWVTEEGGLPTYIRAIAHAMERQGHDKSSAIRNAIGAVKRWASGGGGVSAGTRARAAKAVAEWEAKKASAHAHAIESDKALIGQVPETVAASALAFGLTEMALGDLADLTAEFGVMGVDGGPTHAGLCMKAADTGRVLMLQRALDDPTDPAAGKWEFPGGGHEDGDATSLHTAIREWQEEVGQPFPKNVLVAGVWSAPNGVYQGHIVLVPDESVVSPAEGRMYPNPDDPDGDNSESVAWWHPDDAAANPALREEAKLTPWDTIKAAGFTLPQADDGNDVEPDGDPDDAGISDGNDAEPDGDPDDNEKDRVLIAGGWTPAAHPRGAGGKFAPLSRGAGYDTSNGHGQRQNDRVKQAQKALTDLGYSVGPEGQDGMLGPHTEAGIRDFQRTNGLDVTGIIDRATHHALQSNNAKHNSGTGTSSHGGRSHGHAASRFVPTPQKGTYAMDGDIDLESLALTGESLTVEDLATAGPADLIAFSIGTLEAAGPAFAITAKDRRKAADEGSAMNDGSYPIRNSSELNKAVKAFPRGAGNGKTKTGIKRHIIKRARSLKKTSVLPQDWTPKTAAAELPALVASAEIDGDWMPVLAAAVTEVPPVDVPEDVGGGVKFRIPILLPTGIESGDRREFKADGVEHRDLPIPLYWQKTTDDGHKASVIVARIDSINKIKDGLGDAEGEFDNSPEAEEALRLVRGLFLRGVSADVDKVDAEMSKADDGKPKVTFNEGRVTAATLVGKPAFAECMIELPGDKEWEQNMANLRNSGDEDGPQPIAAAGGPMFPSSEWFADPNLSEPTPLTVTDDGRVFGHLASWDTDHIGMPFQKPPRSKSGYRYFATGQLKTAEGEFVNVGQLTLLGGHADLSLSADAAVKHYDDTNSAVADVVVGEDAFGIWAAGAMRPGLTDMQMRQFRASKPSGDWRPIGNNLELVACLQVNTPGFPVPRARVASAGTGNPVITALVAAGAVMDRTRTVHTDDLAQRVERLEEQRRAEVAMELRAMVASVKQIEADELRRRVKAAAHGDEEGE